MGEGLAVEIFGQIVEAVKQRVLSEIAESNQPSETPEFVTIDEACEFLRCNKQRIYDLRSSGRLTRFSDGSKALVSTAELRRHIGSA